MRPQDEEDRRRDEHTDRRGGKGTRERALPEHDGREHPDADHRAPEAAHRPRQVGSCDGDNRRRDGDAQGGEGRVARSEQRREIRPLSLDDASDDLAHPDHEEDSDNEGEAERAVASLQTRRR